MPDDQARSGDTPPTRPTPFQFKVTWSSVYAKLPETSRCRALVKSGASALWNRPAAKPAAAWSMVVPKMQRSRPAKVLQIAPPAAARTTKVVESKELFAFFAPAAALAACLVLFLIQFVPTQRFTVVRPPDFPRMIRMHNGQVSAARPSVEEWPRGVPSVARKSRELPTPNLEAAPAVAEIPRAIETPAPPPARLAAISPPSVPIAAPAVPIAAPIAAPVVYRPDPAAAPPLMEGFESSRVLRKVKPVYPERASVERVQGTVRLKATINRDGSVQRVVPESGPALLFDAASDAVRQWMFLPARLNGDPVEDVIHINIGFAIVSPEQRTER